MKELFKRSKEDVLKRWDGGEEILNKIQEPKASLFMRYASVVAMVCLIVISYNYFGSSNAALENIQLSDFYGDEEEMVTDELQDSYNFYEDMV